MSGNEKVADIEAMHQLLELACKTDVGMVDSQFLCQSVGALDLSDPMTVREETSLDAVIRMLKANNMGCVLVVDAKGELKGIFSERDFITKVYDQPIDISTTPVSTFMTVEPFTVTTDSPIAFVLNLMADGGFRHVPVVDQDNHPIAIVSVRDIVQVIVRRFTGELLNVELSKE